MKKILKIVGVFVLAVVVLLIAAPFLLKDQIAQVIKDKLNNSLNAQVDFAEVDLSLFSAFPDASLNLKKLQVINKEPFVGDTLFYSDAIKLSLPVMDLFNEVGEPIEVHELTIDDAIARLKVNATGAANWDIAVRDSAFAKAETTQTPQENTGFVFDLNHYEINNSSFSYIDEESKNVLLMNELNHEGTGDFSLNESTLQTITNAKVTYELDGIKYINDQDVSLVADVLMNLDDQRYTFKENEAKVNDLPLELDGFVDLEENSTLVDLTFKTPSSDFKNFFALIPQEYRSNLEGITTTGDFIVNGTINGEVTDELIPKMDIKVSSQNASFKYPDLPQTIRNINFNAALLNTTGKVEDTYLSVPSATFNLAGETVSAKALVTRLTENMKVDLEARGIIDLLKLQQAIPFPDNTSFNGILDLDIATVFDMESVENERYANIQTKGLAKLRDFTYQGDAFNQSFDVSTAVINMNNSRVKLESFNARTGNTDLNASGTINNLIGFLFEDQKLKGNFKVSSDQFDTSDFMSTTTGSKEETITTENQSVATTNNEAIKIPDFLDAQLDFNANRVIYDNITLNDVSGIAMVRDETLFLNDLKTKVFNGTIGLDGTVSTKGATPKFKMALNMNELDIAQSFQGFEMFQKLVPLINAFKGKLNTDLEIQGDLSNDLTPVLTTIAGDAFAQLLTDDVDTSQNKLLNLLDNKLGFIDVNDLNLRDITTKLKLNNGAVEIAPFDFNIKDIKVVASGKHSLSNSMDYTLNLEVPAKYFGKEGASLLSKLESKEIDKITVPVPVKLGGSISSPSVDLNLDLAVKNLTNQIIEIQKQKLKDKGEEAANNAINDILQGNNPLDNIKDVIKGDKGQVKDSTQTTSPVSSTADSLKQNTKDKVKETAGNLIKDLFGRNKKKPVDTTKAK
ncbi:membrane protein [Nonlabens sp. MIC269]|uniref:AsmA-like C-terminal region-containing protein n=1 Tax=Nonlabens sp. MIC269 TaxID=1476901 RepID=UPI0007213BC3|nr:AsmA-like C-terminal region-containing protein [Nonlabens sp. MIC269]ALM21232.1 membrane protein [Nonlabens sp. MIC269]